MFLAYGTDKPIEIFDSGLCREQYMNLRAALHKAKEHGTIPFAVEFRNFNFKDWYENWEPAEEVDTTIGQEVISRKCANLEEIYPQPCIRFETHNRDTGTDWDEWWLRHEKFARKSK